MLKFLLNVGVGQKVFEFLQAEGFDASSIIALDATMPDNDILEIANREERMVVTMDKDFGELVYRNKLAHFGVFLLRLEDATGDEKVAVIRQILEGYADLMPGKFCVYKNGRLRIRG